MRVTHLIRILGSLKIAVFLLIAIASVLGWGTLYEARFGTAAVQRFIYHSWWFQGLLVFLALNLATAALERYPWKWKHLPFLLAHIGIILILLGGIIGGRLGIEGQLLIPEGETKHVLELPGNVLVVHEPNPGVDHIFQTNFEATAWVHKPHALFQLPSKDRIIQLVVDRYYPDAEMTERVTEDGAVENPAVHVVMSHEEQQEEAWLFTKDLERFGLRWGEAHFLFLEPTTEQQLTQLLGQASQDGPERGIVTIELPDLKLSKTIPVPMDFTQPIPIEGTPYTVTFKDYFADFAITDEGPVNRSDQPNNPAVAFLLSGPEGKDAHLVFAFHPDFPAMHEREHKIHAHVGYTHPAGTLLPPNSIALIRPPSGTLSAALTGPAGERQHIEPIELGKRYTHPWLGYQFEVAALYPRAKVHQQFTNRSNEVRAEALHIVAQEGSATADAWLTLQGSVELSLGGKPISVAYRPAQRELPFTVKLLDFRKIDYPGTQMAAGFESDVEVNDLQRGILLTRKIKMNNPLKYRGFSLYQSSYVPGTVETTVLSVRKDPGTPFVYAGFIIVILGVVAMFILRAKG